VGILGGYSVVHKHLGAVEVVRGWRSEKTYSTNQVEMLAVAESIATAAEMTIKYDLQNAVIKIFCDALRVQKPLDEAIDLQMGQSPESLESAVLGPIRRMITKFAYSLESRGCQIEVHWIPRASNVFHDQTSHDPSSSSTTKPKNST
jgi:hypothetical protein